MSKKVRVLIGVFCGLALLSTVLLIMYSTGTLEYVINPTTEDKLSYSEKESDDEVETTWVLNEEYIKNHLPAEVLPNTLITNKEYKASTNAYTTCYTYCCEQGEDVQVENITAINNAYAFGTYAKGDKNYYVVAYNTTYEEDGTFVIMQYERFIE